MALAKKNDSTMLEVLRMFHLQFWTNFLHVFAVVDIPSEINESYCVFAIVLPRGIKPSPMTLNVARKFRRICNRYGIVRGAGSCFVDTQKTIKWLLRVLSHVQDAPEDVEIEKHVFNANKRWPSLRK